MLIDLLIDIYLKSTKSCHNVNEISFRGQLKTALIVSKVGQSTIKNVYNIFGNVRTNKVRYRTGFVLLYTGFT